MIIIKNKIIPFGDYSAINLYGILFYKKIKLDEIIINHELIHSKQYKELLIIGLISFIILKLIFIINFWWSLVLFLTLGLSLFYILYVLEWILKGFSYNNISFEREAYDNQYDSKYLKNRKLFSWIKYVKRRI